MAKVIVIEDDKAFGSMVMLSLEAEGHSVRLFDQAQKAVEGYMADPAAIIVTDVIFRSGGRPQAEGGILAAHRIKAAARKQGREVAVIVMSGAYQFIGMENIFDIARSVGADAVLAKPFEPGDLTDLIMSVLAKQNASD